MMQRRAEAWIRASYGEGLITNVYTHRIYPDSSLPVFMGPNVFVFMLDAENVVPAQHNLSIETRMKWASYVYIYLREN